MWDREPSFIIDIVPKATDIDAFGHVNNAVYVKWLEDCAWQHSNSLGLNMDVYKQLDRGMAVIRHEIDYLASSYCNDQLQLATWIVEMDNKLRISRQFQLINPHNQQTNLRAKTIFCCIQLSTGKPKRMPREFIECYGKVVLSLTQLT